jgi:putative ABC transport system permease protein
MTALNIYFRFLLRNRIFSFISIGGFSISLAVVLLLVSFIRSEKQVDKSVPHVDQIYRILGRDNSANIPEQTRDKLRSDFPQVMATTKLHMGDDPALFKEENYNLRIIHTDSGFFDVFSVPVLSGQRGGFFKDPHQAVLTESCARRIFGEDNPIGQVLTISHQEDVEVVAVVQDLPEKSSMQGDLFCSAELRLRYSLSGHNEQEAYMYNIYLKLHPDADPESLEAKLSDLIHPFMDWVDVDYRLQPFKEAYFDISVPWDNLSHANVKLIRLLSWLALIILFLAVFNYVNLAIAQSTGRLHELGVKQVFGADRHFLIRQFIREAFLQILLALLLAFIIAILINPLLSKILGKEIYLRMILTDLYALVLLLAGLILIAVLSGFYPALSILRLQPSQMLLNKATSLRSSFDIRRILTVFQFTAMVALIISLITLVKQVRFVQDKDLGYSTELLVRIPVHHRIKDNVPVLMEEISKLAVVNKLCASHGTPGAIWGSSSNDELSAAGISTDFRFVQTFGLEMLYGRNFFEAESAKVSLINESMLADLGGWDSAENLVIFGSEIVGVFEDFHFKDLYTPMGNLQIYNNRDVSHLCVRFHPGDISASLKQVEELFTRHAPGFAFSYEFYEQWMEAKYKQEERRSQSIKLLSIIAVLLSCMGLFGMAEFTTRKRMKEIGIRKVNGATELEMVGNLSMGFLKWIVPGVFAGIPLGWYFMQKWLSGFAYKTTLDWWIFVVAALVSTGVALLTVSWQTWKAARRNPVQSLRYE